jgi:histidinol-phosphatase (PHP family)
VPAPPPRPVALPPDDHVHSEWSWDATAGSMDRTCRRALELGLPAVAFTEHADFAPRVLTAASEVPDRLEPMVDDGVLAPPPLDVAGYLEALERCRASYPQLRIRSGVELSEPHWHPGATDDVLTRGGFDRVLASVHSARVGAGHTDVSARYDEQPAAEVVGDYLAEVAAMVEGHGGFEVLAHIDFAVRYWPADAPPYEPGQHEADYRRVLRALVDTDRVLEVNTRVPLHPQVLGWWREEGGAAITFASDAHRPEALADGFAEAVQVARAAGFRPGEDPHGFWCRD